MTTSILLPVFVLVAWSLLINGWMGLSRVTAMQKAKIHPEKTRHTRGGILDTLPASVRQVGDNYNHLMEQPTLFYALAVGMAAGGLATEADIWIAWAYVGSRIAHSLWQTLVNKVLPRFMLFVVSTLILFALAIRAILAVMHMPV